MQTSVRCLERRPGIILHVHIPDPPKGVGGVLISKETADLLRSVDRPDVRLMLLRGLAEDAGRLVL